MAGDEALDERFRDPLVRAEWFMHDVLVRCPACDGCARVLVGRDGQRLLWRQTRLRCPVCGLAKDAAPRVLRIAAPVDPCLQLPLWLQAPCCGEVLWAYNADHLDLLESYVAARLRERGEFRGTMSMVERLPAWVKRAKNRDEILRVIRRLRALVPAADT